MNVDKVFEMLRSDDEELIKLGATIAFNERDWIKHNIPRSTCIYNPGKITMILNNQLVLMIQSGGRVSYMYKYEMSNVGTHTRHQERVTLIILPTNEKYETSINIRR